MANSFLLKNAAGRTVGYVQQAANRIRCSVSMATDAVQIEWYTQDGACICKDVCEGENEWETTGGLLLGACLTTSGKRMADTGESARTLHTRRKSAQTARTAKHEQKTAQPEPDEEEEREQQNEPGQTAKNRPVPERRWPPPPCCPDAVYRNGQWQTGEQT